MSVSGDECDVKSKTSTLDKVFCSGCKTAAVRKVTICDTCKATQHKSCYEKYGCCGNKKKQQDPYDEDCDNIGKILDENKSLKKTINELEQAFNLLRENNLKLQEENRDLKLKQTINNNRCDEFVSQKVFSCKISELLGEINNIKSTLNKTLKNETRMLTFAEVAGKEHVDFSTSTVHKKPDKTKQNKTNFKCIGTPTNLNVLENKQLKIMNEVININSDNTGKTPPGDDLQVKSLPSKTGNDWQQIKQNKKKRNNSTIIGNSDNCGSIKAIPKYINLHVYRLSPETTEEHLKTHLKNDFPEVVCEKMTSKYPNLYSSFKISVFEDNSQEVMNPNMWPAGTCINRFLFLRHKNNKPLP